MPQEGSDPLCGRSYRLDPLLLHLCGFCANGAVLGGTFGHRYSRVPGDNYPERSASITLSGWRAGSPTEAFASPVGLIGLVSSDDRRGRCQADASMTNR